MCSGHIDTWLELLNIDSLGNVEPKFWHASDIDLSAVPEARVIEQDVKRTRADEIFYSSEKTRQVMLQALLRYCAFFRICYMQGLNEILAPLLSLNANFDSKHNEKGTPQQPERINDALTDAGQVLSTSVGQIDDEDTVSDWTHVEVLDTEFDVHLAVFEKLMERLAPVTFSTEGVQALQSQLASFHMLLYYFEADLASFLAREGMTADIYAPPWFITVFARRAPVNIALHLWARLLRSNKPHLVIFLGVALMQVNKKLLMNISSELLPETIVRLHFKSIVDLDEIFGRVCMCS